MELGPVKNKSHPPPVVPCEPKFSSTTPFVLSIGNRAGKANEGYLMYRGEALPDDEPEVCEAKIISTKRKRIGRQTHSS